MTLKNFFEKYNKAALAFSGGVDSSYLLYAAKKHGCNIMPYFVKSQFQTKRELNDAKKICEIIGVNLKVITVDILQFEKVVSNPLDRCYHCKTQIMTTIIKEAKKDGFDILFDGTNASDDASDRPGMKALSELKVISPLKECSITKDMVRSLSKEANLFTWNKSANACLATRIPNNQTITQKSLEKIEKSEDIMQDLGFYDFRVRTMEDTAKIQIPKEQFLKAAELRQIILENLSPYFKDVLLDLKPR